MSYYYTEKPLKGGILELTPKSVEAHGNSTLPIFAKKLLDAIDIAKTNPNKMVVLRDGDIGVPVKSDSTVQDLQHSWVEAVKVSAKSKQSPVRS